MKIILLATLVVLSLIATSEAQPWGYYTNSYPGYYHAYRPVVYHTAYAGHYRRPYAWHYGFGVNHAQKPMMEATPETKAIEPEVPVAPEEPIEVDIADYDIATLGGRTDAIA